MVGSRFEKQGLPAEFCPARRLGVTQLVPCGCEDEHEDWGPWLLLERDTGSRGLLVREPQGALRRAAQPGLMTGTQAAVVPSVRGPEGHGEVDGQVAGQLRRLVPWRLFREKGVRPMPPRQLGVFSEHTGPAEALPFLGSLPGVS